MEASEFMLQLMKSLMEERKVAESTATAYIKVLYQLNDKKAFKNLTFLKNIEGMTTKIDEYAESTKKSIYATIVSVLSLYKDKATFKKVFQHYSDKMMELAKEAGQKDTSVKTEKQEANWLSWEDVEKKKIELESEVAKAGKKLNNAQYDKLLQWVILSLYTDIQPRRNQDYLDMYIVKKYNDKMPTDKNYLDLATKQFIFNKYKTHRKYGQQKEAIPDSLWGAVSKYLSFHPLYKGVVKRKNDPVKFLVSSDGKEMTAVNAITRVLNRVFGKKIGSSMLRHIYLSDKYKDLTTEMKNDAEAMGHSVAQQKAYIKKDDDDDDD